MNYNFHQDKIDGDTAEVLVLQIIQADYPKSRRIEGKESRWDIEVIKENDTVFKTVEVKNDLMAKKTGNLAIETGKTNGQPSGLYVSQADFWVQKVGSTLYWMSREDLKAFCESNSFRSVPGGDRKSVNMTLVPIAKIANQSWVTILREEDYATESD